MYVCTISTLFVVVVVCMYVQESPVCIFYPIVWYIHMVLTAILRGPLRLAGPRVLGRAHKKKGSEWRRERGV